jgi:hypothetical protein
MAVLKIGRNRKSYFVKAAEGIEKEVKEGTMRYAKCS